MGLHEGTKGSGAGGVIRDSNDTWIGGFMHNIGRASSMMAELWGVCSGMDLAWFLGCPRLTLEVDSANVRDLVIHQTIGAPLLRPLLTFLGTCLLGTGRSQSYICTAKEIVVQIDLFRSNCQLDDYLLSSFDS
ncbi:hypothetical protein CRG98_043748 [Punica granatum]|uniref:RNase H type-1 domain-containing protein n=1 Tax=Punica granatum TaxID=22663 RepID=A0A2I0HVV4_PUNGR|nr:hypothetical protein CRG98_043748 [Punica granatum]